MLDSIGLQLSGQGEWFAAWHALRRWRKLHIAIDAGTNEVAATW